MYAGCVERPKTTAMSRRVIVFGPPDRFTGEVAAHIAALRGAECVYGAPTAETGEPRARPDAPSPCRTVSFDPDDAASVRELIGPAFAAVNLYEAYPGADRFIVPASCAALGVHYVDVCDSREHVSTFARLEHAATTHDALLVTRANAVSVLTAMLADMLALEFDRVNELHVTLTPGMDGARATAANVSVERMLQLARVKHGGRWRRERWWDKADVVSFPAGMGQHRRYGCHLPCLEELLKRYEARTATAHIAFKPSLENSVSSTTMSTKAPIPARASISPSVVIQRSLYFILGSLPQAEPAGQPAAIFRVASWTPSG